MRVLVIDDEAEADVLRAAIYYEDRRKGLGQRFVEYFMRGTESIEKFPASYAARHHDYRFFHLDEFPFSIVYSFDDREIYILAVKDDRRDPDEWKKRIPE